MLLNKTTPCQVFVVWAPKYHDRTVKLMDFRIGTHNEITFPKAKSLPGKYYISGKEAKKWPTKPMKTKSGQWVIMRCIPQDKLEPLEREGEVKKSVQVATIEPKKHSQDVQPSLFDLTTLDKPTFKMF